MNQIFAPKWYRAGLTAYAMLVSGPSPPAPDETLLLPQRASVPHKTTPLPRAAVTAYQQQVSRPPDPTTPTTEHLGGGSAVTLQYRSLNATRRLPMGGPLVPDPVVETPPERGHQSQPAKPLPRASVRAYGMGTSLPSPPYPDPPLYGHQAQPVAASRRQDLYPAAQPPPVVVPELPAGRGHWSQPVPPLPRSVGRAYAMGVSCPSPPPVVPDALLLGRSGHQALPRPPIYVAVLYQMALSGAVPEEFSVAASTSGADLDIAWKSTPFYTLPILVSRPTGWMPGPADQVRGGSSLAIRYKSLNATRRLPMVGPLPPDPGTAQPPVLPGLAGQALPRQPIHAPSLYLIGGGVTRDAGVVQPPVVLGLGAQVRPKQLPYSSVLYPVGGGVTPDAGTVQPPVLIGLAAQSQPVTARHTRALYEIGGGATPAIQDISQPGHQALPFATLYDRQLYEEILARPVPETFQPQEPIAAGQACWPQFLWVPLAQRSAYEEVVSPPVPSGLPSDLLAALKVWYSGQVSLQGLLPGGFWLSTARTSTFPYAVVREISSTPNLMTQHASYEFRQYQFSVFATTATVARTVGKQLRAAINDTRPVLLWEDGVMSGTFQQLGAPGLMRDPDVGPLGQQVWQQVWTYLAHVVPTVQ